MSILVTGVAGFIGYHVADRLLREGKEVLGIDNINSYYDPRLKESRLARLDGREGFRFERCDVGDRGFMERLFAREKPEIVIHLAAQAGVRYSIQNPHAYIESNIAGFMNILEGCRHHGTKHLVYASSSSVYGANVKMPFSVDDTVDHPVSLYAATKKANELMAHTYSHLYGLPTTGLRFFTVYGPWGRPDMALFLFTDSILKGKPIDVFNHGKMQRDFTYIDDIVDGILRVAARVPEKRPFSPDTLKPGTSYAPYRVYNIGNNSPVELLDMIQALEEALGITAKKNFLPMQAGDVPATYADIQALQDDCGFKPSTGYREGVRKFVAWYKEYHKIGSAN